MCSTSWFEVLFTPFPYVQFGSGVCEIVTGRPGSNFGRDASVFLKSARLEPSSNGFAGLDVDGVLGAPDAGSDFAG